MAHNSLFLNAGMFSVPQICFHAVGDTAYVGIVLGVLTVRRGLQLHLLSALGEIWREESLPNEQTAKGEFISLSVVMEVSAGSASFAGAEARHLLEENGK